MLIQFDVEHYLRDTYGLSFAEHGAYLLSIIEYYKKGGALTHLELRNICGNQVDRVCRFYLSCDGVWHHKRIDRDLARLKKRRDAMRKKAMLGVEARRKMGQLPEKGKL